MTYSTGTKTVASTIPFAHRFRPLTRRAVSQIQNAAYATPNAAQYGKPSPAQNSVSFIIVLLKGPATVRQPHARLVFDREECGKAKCRSHRNREHLLSGGRPACPARVPLNRSTDGDGRGPHGPQAGSYGAGALDSSLRKLTTRKDPLCRA